MSIKGRVIKYFYIITLLFLSCNSLVTTFDDVESAVEYTSVEVVNQSLIKDTVSVMTWNIRFGAGRIDWFGDHCGDRVF